ncbi:MAG: GGDEF domain-containing protein [Desulfobacterales bacterium]|nr:GGDEF domain-containing protein [Desulfobacterales bacterium]
MHYIILRVREKIREIKNQNWSTRLKSILVSGLVISGLYITSLYKYILFHSLAEIFSIIIGCCIFILVWNSQKHLDNGYLVFLGIAYLFISFLDLVHALAYKGMGIFTANNANLPTQLWIAARFLQSISLLIAPVYLHRKINTQLVIWCYLSATALLLTTIFTGIFPICFVEGLGLTPFKIVSEYLIMVILIISSMTLLRNQHKFDQEVLRWLIISLFFTIVAEVAFTTYVSVYDFSNLLGHIFKIIAFYFIYKAIVNMGIEKPQRLLYRSLKQSETQLQKALKAMEKLAVTDDLTSLYNRRQFLFLANNEFQRARRYKHSLSIIILDIDTFKQINDSKGHMVGDQVLREVARRCSQELRTIDVFGRYGGDEFAIMLPESDLTEASQIAERLRNSISMNAVNTDVGPVIVTISMGIANLSDKYSTLNSLIAGADQALLAAKRTGRNRTLSAADIEAFNL